MLSSLHVVFAQKPCDNCITKKKYNFKLIKKQGLRIDSTKVRLDGIYMLSDSGSKKTYTFYRFFSNGRVFRSCNYCSIPDSSQLNDLNYGSYGYYRIDSNMIKIETFAPYPRYYFKYLKINGKEIEYSYTSDRQWKNNLTFYPTPHLRYVFIPYVLHSKPFW
jgi:hypothetical protein